MTCTLICRPGDQHRTLVNETGELIYRDERFERRVRFGIASNETPIEVEHFTADPCVPIVTTIVRYRTCTLDLRACGHRDPAGRRVDVVRWRLSAEHAEPGVVEAFQVEFVGDDEPDVITDTVLHPQSASGPGGGLVMRTACSSLSAGRAMSGSMALLIDGPAFEGPRLDPGWADEAFGVERRFWAEVPLNTIELRVPDRALMDLMSASARTIIQASEARPSTLDAYVLAEAAQFLGRADLARQQLDAALTRSQPGRCEARTAAHLEETAACIAMIVRQHELDGTSELTPQEVANLRHALPRIGDELGGSDKLATRLWMLAALSMVTRLAGVSHELQTMVAEIMAGGGTSLPVVALTQAVYPWEAFDPDDPLVAGMRSLLEAASDNTRLPSYATSFYADAWLYFGHPEKATDYMDAFASHASQTGVWTDRQTVEAPGVATAAAFVRLIRNLLIFERDDHLELLAGVPPSWFHAGAEIVVERSPTKFGPVSILVSVSVDADNVVNFALEADWVTPPERIVVRPPEAATSVFMDGRPVDEWEDRLVAAPARRLTATFVCPQTPRPVARHASTKAALRDWTAFSSAYPFKPDIRTYRQYPIESDGAAHDEYRAILASWFRRGRVSELEPQIRAVAAATVAGLASGGQVDAVREIALPMVVGTLGVTLGRPQDVDEWSSWGVAINVVHGHRDGRETDAYLARVFDEVGLHPGDDVFTHIAAARGSDGSLTRRERLGLGSMVLTAGRAATVNLISGAIWLLASQPGDRARLAADSTLLANAIEEMLRYLSPVPEMDRTVVNDIDGFPAGSHVILSFVSANHDATVFPDPGTLNMNRRPNHHMAFGNGPHTCIGAHLAKLEARVLLEELLRIVPDFECNAEPEITWQRIGGTDVPRDFISVPIGVVQ